MTTKLILYTENQLISNRVGLKTYHMTPKPIFALCLALFPLLLFAQLPAGSIARYSLDNSAVDVSGNGYNGTLTSTSGTANRFATANGATGFTAGSSTGTLPGTLVTAMQDDFSIGYWFNTTMTAPGAAQWYSGTALIDAEVCGSTSDWGTALINGGGVSMGIGNPDITIASPSTSYNDGNWHFVTGTRAEASGTIILYVDGVQVATTSGTATTPRTAPSIIGLGRNDCDATGVYTGSLDDVIAYARVLSPTEVTNLFNYYTATALPLTWVSFTGQAKADQVLLQWQTANVVGNADFEIDRSTDGVNFAEIGLLSNGDSTVVDPGTYSYHFLDPNPVKGLNFYRLKQVDYDGHSSYSAVVEVNIGSALAAFRLQTNPVASTVTLVNTGQQMVERMQVIDVSGRVIIDQAPNSTNSLLSENVQQLQSGYYFLRISSNNNTATLPFIKL
jgi:hypothetical protein